MQPALNLQLFTTLENNKMLPAYAHRVIVPAEDVLGYV